MIESKVYMPEDRPPLSQWLPLSLQHVFAMFGATVLVPILVGFDPAAALFTAGTGTLIYILCTGAKVPAFLGSSFAFIPPLIAVTSTMGPGYALGGAVAGGLFYCLVAGVVKFAGTSWLDKALPPLVIGSVIVTIGLNLAPIAMSMAMNDASGNYSLKCLSVAAVTLGTAIFFNVFFKGFISAVPILMALVVGYVTSLFLGMIDFSPVTAAPWFGLPAFALPKFNAVVAFTFVIVSLATACEHIGDIVTTSRVVGRDFYKKPGLHRTLLGDGLATAWAAFWGGPPNTTYGENIGVMAITKVYSVWVIGGAAVIAVVLSFFRKFGAVISTIPTPVLGGVSMLLFGVIASSGLRAIVESGVDFKDKRNLTISSVILVIGIGGGKLAFALGGDAQFELAGVALAAVAGVFLNLVLPKTKV